jgi:hypothetical protein
MFVHKIHGYDLAAALVIIPFFTREYTKYTAGFTFCFVVVVVVGVVVIESL